MVPIGFRCLFDFDDQTVGEALAAAAGEFVELPFSKAVERWPLTAQELDEFDRIEREENERLSEPY